MEDSILLGKEFRDCPICGRYHEVEKRTGMATIEIQGEEVTYEETYYLCPLATGEYDSFEAGGMTDSNLSNARNAYKKKMGLPTS